MHCSKVGWGRVDQNGWRQTQHALLIAIAPYTPQVPSASLAIEPIGVISSGRKDWGRRWAPRRQGRRQRRSRHTPHQIVPNRTTPMARCHVRMSRTAWTRQRRGDRQAVVEYQTRCLATGTSVVKLIKVVSAPALDAQIGQRARRGHTQSEFGDVTLDFNGARSLVVTASLTVGVVTKALNARHTRRKGAAVLRSAALAHRFPGSRPEPVSQPLEARSNPHLEPRRWCRLVQSHLDQRPPTRPPHRRAETHLLSRERAAVGCRLGFRWEQCPRCRRSAGRWFLRSPAQNRLRAERS